MLPGRDPFWQRKCYRLPYSVSSAKSLLSLGIVGSSENMIRILLFFMIGLLTSSGAEEKPNLLFIFLDDFGWKDTSYMGSDFYETPNLDQLAKEGMIFTNAYSAAANCAPARACLLSGQYSPRHQIFNVGTTPRGKAAHRRLEHIPGVSTLDLEISTWAECIQGEGYKTATMGKWHLSDDPIPYGFDVNIAGTHSGSPPRGYYPPHPKVPNLGEVADDEYLTNTIIGHADSFLRGNESNPWMLYLTLFAVHTPLNANREFVEKYAAKESGELHDHVAMATMIETVDRGVGRLMRTLEETGVMENTIIVFFSDNGGYGPATDMAPLKGYKGTYYEGGIRVPMFVRWPGVVEGGQSNDTPVSGVDVFPTFCEMLGVNLPEGQPLDGVSLVPLLRGESHDLAERALFWHFPAYLQSYSPSTSDEQRDPLFRSRPCSIIRKGKWKLHEYFERGEFELYNLEDDIGETQNLAEKESDVLSELQADLVSWRKSIQAPVPAKANPEFDEQSEAKAIQAILKKRKNK